MHCKVTFTFTSDKKETESAKSRAIYFAGVVVILVMLLICSHL